MPDTLPQPALPAPNPATAGAAPPSPHEPVAHVAAVPPVAVDVAPPGTGGWFARVWPLLAVRRGLFAMAFTAALAALLAQVAVPRVLMAAVDTLDQPGAVRRWSAVLVGLAAVRALGTLGQRSLLLRSSYDLEADLRTLVFGHLGRLGAATLGRVPAGEVISRANSDVRAVQLYVTFSPVVALNVASGVLALVLMLGVSVPLTLAALAPMPVVVWASLRMRADLYPASWLVQARQAEVASLVEEDVMGVRVVRTMAAEQQRVTALARSARRLAWATGYQFEVRARDAPLVEHLPRIGLALVLAVGGWLVARGGTTVGAILAFSSYVLLLQTPFRMIGAIVMMAQRAAAAGERILELLDTTAEVAQAHTHRGQSEAAARRSGCRPGCPRPRTDRSREPHHLGPTRSRRTPPAPPRRARAARAGLGPKRRRAQGDQGARRWLPRTCRCRPAQHGLHPPTRGSPRKQHIHHRPNRLRSDLALQLRQEPFEDDA